MKRDGGWGSGAGIMHTAVHAGLDQVFQVLLLGGPVNLLAVAVREEEGHGWGVQPGGVRFRHGGEGLADWLAKLLLLR